MSQSLKDQLLGLGYKPPAVPEPKPRPRSEPSHPQAKPDDKPQGRPRPASRDGKPHAHAPSARDASRRQPQGAPAKPSARPNSARPARSREEIDLAKAYALRAQKEKDERVEAERIKQEEARKRREAKATLAELLKDKALNDPAAEIARHFPYGGKIKRIHVTPSQLKALNAGELGVAQMDGRYLLLPLALLLQAEAIFPPAVALKVDPDAAPGADPYSDPAYPVPDDLVW